jgi:hypothetical protein
MEPCLKYVRPLLLAVAILVTATMVAGAQDQNLDIDVALALGVDISYSMNADEQRLQRLGYAEALTSKLVLDGIKAGPNGRIAVTYYEWASDFDRRTIVPWTIIDGPASAAAFVARLQAIEPRRASRTSISGGIDYGAQLLAESPYRAIRKVIDISGDGPNNNGRPVEVARNEAIAKGIVINGLPILLARALNTYFDIDNLDEYYADCVIGGRGAFMLPITTREQFAEATRQKLLKEIAGDDTPPRLLKVGDAPGTDCMVGERFWRERYERN